MEIKPIAHIETDFMTKFGVPRQSGIVKHQIGRVVMEKDYRVRDAFRGLEGFSHIWLLWDFSEAHREQWSPTVRPPRLGGNKRIGVFATRAPYRPNNIGLSSVRLHRIDFDDKEGPVLYVEGADLVNMTPIYDIKPYLAYTDSHEDALSGFVENEGEAMFSLEVEIDEKLAQSMPNDKVEALREVLANDPRPHYHDDSERIYKMNFANKEIQFRVVDGKIICARSL